MSQNQDQNDQPPSREVAHRLFAAEFNDATYTFQESDDDRAPVYALLPTGEKANRVFIVGTLTETNNVGNDEEYWQGRIVDPTDTVFAYAGQYQPEAAAFLREIEPPAFVAIVGKPRSYETDDGMVNVSLRPEHITNVDKQTRQRWVTETASRTLDRVEKFDTDGNPYARMAREHYGGNIEQYRQQVIEALESLDETTSEKEDSETQSHNPKADTKRDDEVASNEPSTASTIESENEAPPSQKVKGDKRETERGSESNGDELTDFDSEI